MKDSTKALMLVTAAFALAAIIILSSATKEEVKLRGAPNLTPNTQREIEKQKRKTQLDVIQAKGTEP